MANKTISDLSNERLSPNGDDYLLTDSQSEALSYKIKVSKLLDRTNHTSTQAISTIDGLQTVLDDKQPVGDYSTNTQLTTGLATKEPIIISGTTNQYWRGDKTWQSLDKSAVGLSNIDNTSDLNKPISNATQTALDLKANLASPTFTGNLTLPNNTRINGVEHFYQITKPTVRRDGSALVVGDRWWKTDEGTEWFWNGTYWLGNNFHYIFQNNNNNSQTYTFTQGGIFGNSIQTPGAILGEYPNFFIESVILKSHETGLSGTLDSNNSFLLNVRITLAAPIPIVRIDSLSKIPNLPISYPVNALTNYDNGSINSFLTVTNIVGSPTLTGRISWAIKIRGVQ